MKFKNEKGDLIEANISLPNTLPVINYNLKSNLRDGMIELPESYYWCITEASLIEIESLWGGYKRQATQAMINVLLSKGINFEDICKEIGESSDIIERVLHGNDEKTAKELLPGSVKKLRLFYLSKLSLEDVRDLIKQNCSRIQNGRMFPISLSTS